MVEQDPFWRKTPKSQPDSSAGPTGPPGASHALAASFVVRLWANPPGEASLTYRGEIVHVQSGATAHFTEVAKMVAFMANHVAIDLLPKERKERK